MLGNITRFMSTVRTTLSCQASYQWHARDATAVVNMQKSCISFTNTVNELTDAETVSFSSLLLNDAVSSYLQS